MTIEIDHEEQARRIVEETRSAWQIPQELTVSQWADANRVIPNGFAEPGRWRTERTPYLREIMDAFSDSYTSEIVIMASTQIGKTEDMLNCLGYVIDEDPGPVMWVHTTEPLAKEIADERVIPMIKSSPSLSSHLTGKNDDVTKKGIKLNNMKIYFAWSTSPSTLASRPVRYVLFDETDKYPAFSGKEADPIKLGTERTKTFWNRKIIKCSTPTTKDGYIYKEYKKTDQCRFYVPCPHCNKMQPLVFGQIKLSVPEERDPQIIIEKKLAYYECVECLGRINDVDKMRIMHRGKWISELVGIAAGWMRFRKRGFWINALYSPWLTFSDIIAEFFESKDAINDLMNFVNSWLAEIWERKSRKTDIDYVRKLKCDYGEGVVPERAQVLIGTVDVQEDHFYGVIRAWGPGEESWNIRSMRMESWPEVVNVFFKTRYARSNDDSLPVHMTLIDSGHKTDEVYSVCRKYKDRAKAVKGDDKVTGVPFKTSMIDKMPKTGRAIPGGLLLWRLDVNFFKDKLHRMIYEDDPADSIWHLHNNTSDAYLNQICSEEKILKIDRRTNRQHEVWQKKHGSPQNHYWDCEVYQMAAAEIMRLYLLRDENTTNVYKPRRKSDQKEGPRYSDVIRARKKGWIKRK